MIMRSDETVIVVMTTLPDFKYAEPLASSLVSMDLAACVQIVPQITSVYKWEGLMRQDTEVLLLIKTVSSKFSAVENTIKENHPYMVPEVLAIPASDVSDEYREWLSEVL
jgi:periplasmic divalent cation tolerance protein